MIPEIINSATRPLASTPMDKGALTVTFLGEPSIPMTMPFSSLIAGLLLAACCTYCVGAELRVQGPVDDVQLEARDATVTAILGALSENYGVRYQGRLGSNGITGQFRGPLRRVLARVLEGSNYVIRSRSERLEVIVVNTGVAGVKN
jgi:hypothetical protein